MKKQHLLFALVIAFAATLLPSCKKCKDCTQTVGGVSGSTQELCGDDLKEVEGKEGWSCK